MERMPVFDFVNCPELWNDRNTFTPFLEEKDYETVCKLNNESDASQMLVELFHADRNTNISSNIGKDGRREIDEALTEARQDFPNIEPYIYFFGMADSNEHAIQETYGIQGTSSTGIILIGLHTSYTHTGKLKKCLLHEFNHSSRLQYFKFFEDGTFLDWMIMEGLAETYNLEKFPNEPLPPWTHPLDLKTKEQWIPQINEIWSKKRSEIQGNQEWFFGSDRMKPVGKLGIPKWLGYRLGFELVQKFRWNHPTFSWNELIRIPSVEFVSSWTS